MRSKILCGVVALAATSLCLFVEPVQATSVGAASTRHGHHHRVVLVNGLNASPKRTFDGTNVFSWWPLGQPQAMGSRFQVTRRVTLKEVGAFVNASPDNYGSSTAPPYTVEIRRATSDGRPELGAPLAVSTLSDDGDQDVWRYESARFKLRLGPGLYFAMVTAREPATFDNTRPAGVLGAWGLDDQGNYLYQPDELAIGFINHVNQTSEFFPVHQGPFRVIVRVAHHHHR